MNPHSSPTPSSGLPAILDIEASGFGRGSYPIELGVVDPAGRSFCSLVRPEPDWLHWDPAAEALHGITRDLLDRHGRPARWIASEMNVRLAGQTVYCDGWGQDYSWLGRLFDAADLQPQFRLEDVRRLLTEEQALRWGELTASIRVRFAFARHRASNDARVLQEALRVLRTTSLLLA